MPSLGPVSGQGFEGKRESSMELINSTHSDSNVSVEAASLASLSEVFKYESSQTTSSYSTVSVV